MESDNQDFIQKGKNSCVKNKSKSIFSSKSNSNKD